LFNIILILPFLLISLKTILTQKPVTMTTFINITMRRTWWKVCAVILFAVAGCQTKQPAPPADVSIIPKPLTLDRTGEVFYINPDTRILVPGNTERCEQLAGYLNELISREMNITLPVAGGITDKNPRNAIVFSIIPESDMHPEAYKLKVSKRNVILSAAYPNGLFYGIITLGQLFPVDHTPEQIPVPGVIIEDEPGFSWRGVHLDVSRHFFPVEFIKKYLDIAAMHKLNVFHWHLTDDQGWRIEIKKYPELTNTGAWREETCIGNTWVEPVLYDGTPHGGFYTQEQIREVINYAASRYITVVPEIEMPGHAQAAIASYPELGCTGKKIKVKTEWGISPNIYNVEEGTFAFLEDVLSEVIELFPSDYIHIGGDEALKDQWKASKKIQGQIDALGLETEEELQSYFVQRMEKFINSKGRKLIGWDEILEGGLAPNATVMSWRGMKGGIAAARAGHDVVMSPTTYCYFDYYQGKPQNEPLGIGGFLPVDSVYLFEPVPPEITAEEAVHILGGQANLWTEYIATTEHAEYMLLPRLAALAEVVWLPSEKKDLTDFRHRLETQVLRYRKAGINFRPLD
jgi:hexosaminidase